VPTDRDPPPQLVQRLPVRASWDDLVLPAQQLQQLHEIVDRVAHLPRLRASAGMARSLRHAHGTSALFSGPSGTGKSLAAEVLAKELGLDLWRVDLSAVVSKYIGETEKNLGRVFDAAQGSGAVLLFEDADALLGSRSEVKDSHDRYANLEVAYLLARLANHAGLTILTTNLRHAIDPAFTRRLHYIVRFL
jgi:SpoVK/Ycf46/Vps4 family AAA+-type ATPase